ncbi:helix-turn-helix domain-containing protein [Methylocystis parvus]|uniref:helix-turn-helix domain-containing protein n=1 Tax=Methylocystis parvus TaxID=134 RepID=UPI003C762936
MGNLLLAKIAEVAGADVATAIMRAKGGTRAEFPSEYAVRAGDGGWLVDLVGPGPALAIARKVFPRGGAFDVPLSQEARRENAPYLHELPNFLREVADVAGVEAALALARAYGGTEVTFPCAETIRAGRGGWLASVVGREKALIIARELFPIGGKMLVPMDPMPRLARELRISELLSRGESARSIAREVGCHVRTVHRYRARLLKKKQKKGSL